MREPASAPETAETSVAGGQMARSTPGRPAAPSTMARTSDREALRPFIFQFPATSFLRSVINPGPDRRPLAGAEAGPGLPGGAFLPRCRIFLRRTGFPLRRKML